MTALGLCSLPIQSQRETLDCLNEPELECFNHSIQYTYWGLWAGIILDASFSSNIAVGSGQAVN